MVFAYISIPWFLIKSWLLWGIPIVMNNNPCWETTSASCITQWFHHPLRNSNPLRQILWAEKNSFRAVYNQVQTAGIMKGTWKSFGLFSSYNPSGLIKNLAWESIFSTWSCKLTCLQAYKLSYHVAAIVNIQILFCICSLVGLTSTQLNLLIWMPLTRAT